MSAVDRPLRRHQFAVELGERQASRQYRMLDIEQAVVAGLQPAAVGNPTLGPGVGGVDADIDDGGHLQAPFAHDPEALMVPIRVGDQVDRDIDAERAGEFDCLEIAAERDAFAVFPKPLFVNRLEAEKHGLEPEPLPKAEHFLVAQQDIAPGLEVIALADAGAGDRLADLHSVPLVDESDVVDYEDTGFADRPKILDNPPRADHPIAAAIKR